MFVVLLVCILWLYYQNVTVDIGISILIRFDNAAKLDAGKFIIE